MFEFFKEQLYKLFERSSPPKPTRLKVATDQLLEAAAYAKESKRPAYFVCSPRTIPYMMQILRDNFDTKTISGIKIQLSKNKDNSGPVIIFTGSPPELQGIDIADAFVDYKIWETKQLTEAKARAQYEKARKELGI